MANITFRNEVGVFVVQAYNDPWKKNTVKSFVRENKFHAYLTRETLPAEERVHIFHNHGKKSSCQTFADASMTKVVPKSFEALDGIEEKGPLRLRLGPSARSSS